jgi:Uma2 family endonuclease
MDRTVKFVRYAEGGIAQYWMVDPLVPAVHVYDRVDGGYRLTTTARDDEIVVVSQLFEITMVPSDLQRT